MQGTQSQSLITCFKTVNKGTIYNHIRITDYMEALSHFIVFDKALY